MLGWHSPGPSHPRIALPHLASERHPLASPPSVPLARRLTKPEFRRNLLELLGVPLRRKTHVLSLGSLSSIGFSSCWPPMASGSSPLPSNIVQRIGSPRRLVPYMLLRPVVACLYSLIPRKCRNRTHIGGFGDHRPTIDRTPPLVQDRLPFCIQSPVPHRLRHPGTPLPSPLDQFLPVLARCPQPHLQVFLRPRSRSHVRHFL